MKVIGWIFGIVLIGLGILGYVPGATDGGMLLGLFEVDNFHNMVHIVTGVLALIAASMSAGAAKIFFKVIGVIYLIVAILGFIQGGVLGLFMVNMADNWLHVVIAVVALILGFSGDKK